MSGRTSAARSGPDAAGEWPRVGMVVPVFGHSRLVAEAIGSALDQDYPGKIEIVVVIDGDRDIETLRTVRAFQANRDNPLSVIYRPNGRLSAARNTGIRYLLTRFPDMFAIYLLDADNRLTRPSIRAFAQALLDNREAGWAYPDVTFFGLSWGYDGFDVRSTAPAYSRFRHRMGNICEAGSMVRTEVFRGGVFFDETFIHGYEDWEFWLQCLRKGYAGTRVENPGFLYRRRADSMLADADRMSGDIRRRIHEKHSELFSEDELWRVFAEEFRPLLIAASDETMLLSTSEHAAPVSSEELSSLVLNAFHHYHHAYMPRLVLYPLAADTPMPRIGQTLFRNLLSLRHHARQHFLDPDGNIAAERSEASCWGVIRFEDALLDRPVPDEASSTPACAAIRTGVKQARSLPALGHIARRYSGPPSYRLDMFLEEEPNEISVDQPLDAQPARRCLLVHGMRPGESDPVVERLKERYQATEVNLDRLRTNGARYLNTTLYNGASIEYRQDDPLYEFMGDVAGLFEITYVVNDLSYLFHVGQWKRAASTIVFLATGALTPDQRIALQAMEHSLTRIVCTSAELTQLSALGIPSRKLELLERHLGEEISAHAQ